MTTPARPDSIRAALLRRPRSTGWRLEDAQEPVARCRATTCPRLCVGDDLDDVDARIREGASDTACECLRILATVEHHDRVRSTNSTNFIGARTQ